MRLVIIVAAVAALSLPALAQQQRPQQQRPPAPPPQQAQPQQQPQPAPGMFACRTENEICYIAIVLGPSQISVLYTNDPGAEGVEQKPIAVQAPPGAEINLGQHTGRVVMLVGRYSPQAITGVQLVDVAGPLLSFAIKSMLAGEGELDEEEEEPEPPKPQPRQQPRR
jgi:hypothetical protein